jgi:GAF domain-containing protein
MRAPAPANEAARLEALKRAAILDTPPEPVFDDLVQLAAHVCHTPISTVTFIDADRQWFKARLGLPDRQTSRDISFCAHAILDSTPLIVADATKDRRFADLSNVTGDPHIRFYAGVPLRDRDGFALGTLCVIDRTPRQLAPEEERMLCILARQAEHYIGLRQAGQNLRDALMKVKMLSGLLPMCAWCKRVRDDAQYWQQVDRYLSTNLDAEITHSICPECLEKVERDAQI